MIKFMLKKSLIEHIDRYFLFLAGNFITMGLIFVAVMTYVFTHGNYYVPVAEFIIFYSIYQFIFLGALWGKADKTGSAFVLAVRGLIYGSVFVAVITILISLIRFYYKIGGFGFIGAAFFGLFLILWTAATLYAPYFLTLRKTSIPGAYKYSFRLFFDRPGTGFGVFFLYLFFGILSMSLFVGSSFSICIASQIARAFYKMDEYAQQNPGEEPDWKKIFLKDIQNVDDISLKGLLLPWTKSKK